MSVNVWQRFRQRLMDGNDQAQFLQDWAVLREITMLPPQAALDRLKVRVAIDTMSDTAYEHFRKAMVLVSAAYSQRAGLVGVSDAEEWQRRYIAYLSGPDPEAKQYDTFWILRSNLDGIRPPPAQAPPFSPEELHLSQACAELFAMLAVALNKAGPGLASKALIDELKSLIDRYESLLQAADPGNRARRQAWDAIAEAQYAAGRISLILRDYNESKYWFQKALDSFGRLDDAFGVQCCRRQLTSVQLLSTGDVDEAMRTNLETLTRNRMPAGSLDRAQALISQISQTLTAGDWYAVKKLIEEAVKELDQQGFPDDEKRSPDDALLAWIEGVPADLHGRDFFYRLTEVIQLYAGIWGARASLSEANAIERLGAIRSLTQQLGLEIMKADNDLQQLFMTASGRPLAFRQGLEGA